MKTQISKLAESVRAFYRILGIELWSETERQRRKEKQVNRFTARTQPWRPRSSR